MSVLNPYWGDLGARFAWNNASYSQGGAESFGADGSEDVRALLNELQADTAVEPKQVLTALARGVPSDAVDLLWLVAAGRAGAQEADVLAGMGVEAAALAERAAAGVLRLREALGRVTAAAPREAPLPCGG
ncbi:hypothetical protein ACFY1L_46365 [Streptomyces sp. NPDC001663]|uniref:hypothetical protein n=1 Tax=Streptomyces sp. NPDC001663 TaxID=3364597 RepID=UPI0036992C5C